MWQIGSMSFLTLRNCQCSGKSISGRQIIRQVKTRYTFLMPSVAYTKQKVSKGELHLPCNLKACIVALWRIKISKIFKEGQVKSQLYVQNLNNVNQKDNPQWLCLDIQVWMVKTQKYAGLHATTMIAFQSSSWACLYVKIWQFFLRFRNFYFLPFSCPTDNYAFKYIS